MSILNKNISVFNLLRSMYKNVNYMKFRNVYGGVANIQIPDDPAVLWMT